ncbi:MAG: serine/threonine-protein kinase, partial [Thermoanaerobaculia bacterium]
EFVPGTSLDGVLQASATGISLPRALELAIQLASGMEYVHARGVVHRDLKPSNCLVAADGTLRVMDFGLGKSTGELEKRESVSVDVSSTLNLSILGAGTPSYMAPEQWRSLAEAGKPADVYAFGVTLYELFAGIKPFDSDPAWGARYGERLSPLLKKLVQSPNPVALGILHLYHEEVTPLPMRELRASVPSGIEALALRCLHKEPDERPSFAEIRRSLLGLYRPIVGTSYGRELAHALEPTESGENNRAVSYEVMGESERARGILDAWLGHEPRALYPWINRKSIAMNRAEAEPASVWDEFSRSIEAHHGAALASDLHVEAFRARLSASAMPHPDQVSAVAISPDGGLLLTACRDHRARLFEVGTGKLVRTFEGHASAITSARFSPDGSLVLTGSADRTVRLWERESGKLVRAFVGHTGRVLDVAFGGNPGVVLSASEDRSVRIWDVPSGLKTAVLGPHEGSVLALAVSADGAFAMTATGDPVTHRGDGRVRVSDLALGKPIRALTGHTGAVLSIALSADGRFVLTGGSDRTARLWELATGKLIRTIEGHGGEILAVAFSPDGEFLLTGGADRQLRIFHTVTGAAVRTLSGHLGPITSLAFSPDGQRIVSGSGDVLGSADRTARLWFTHATPAVPAWPLLIRRAFSASERMSQERERKDLLVRLADLDLSAYASVQSLRERTTEYQRDVELVGAIHRVGFFGGVRVGVRDVWTSSILKVGSGVTSVAFASEGRLIVAGSWDGAVSLWDTAGARLAERLPNHAKAVSAVAVGPDHRTILSADATGVTRLRDGKGGKLIAELTGAVSEVTGAAFGADGTSVLVVHRDGTALSWALGATPAASRAVPPSGPISALAVSPDGAFALLGRHENAVLWDLKRGTEVFTLTGHESRIGALAFSADGRFLATASKDRTAMIWDSGTGQRLGRLEGHQRDLTSVAFSPDGRLLVTGSRDGTARVWDARHGTLLSTLLGHEDEVATVAFSASGRLVLTGSADRTVRLWVIDSDWLFLEEVLPEVETFLAGQSAGKLWSRLRGETGDLEGWLDVWTDLKRCGARSNLSAELVRRRDDARSRLLEGIAYLAWGTARTVPANAGEMLAHPIVRASLADPELGVELAARTGADAQRILHFDQV